MHAINPSRLIQRFHGIRLQVVTPPLQLALQAHPLCPPGALNGIHKTLNTTHPLQLQFGGQLFLTAQRSAATTRAASSLRKLTVSVFRPDRHSHRPNPPTAFWQQRSPAKPGNLLQRERPQNLKNLRHWLLAFRRLVHLQGQLLGRKVWTDARVESDIGSDMLSNEMPMSWLSASAAIAATTNKARKMDRVRETGCMVEVRFSRLSAFVWLKRWLRWLRYTHRTGIL